MDIETNNNATEPKPDNYWASEDTRTCGDEVLKRCADYWTFCMSKGWFTLWRRLYYAYNPNRYSLGGIAIPLKSLSLVGRFVL